MSKQIFSSFFVGIDSLQFSTTLQVHTLCYDDTSRDNLSCRAVRMFLAVVILQIWIDSSSCGHNQAINLTLTIRSGPL